MEPGIRNLPVGEKLRALITVDPITGCHVWRGNLDRKGYGRVNNKRAHRVSYEHAIGPIPPGLDLDHLCRNRACINPDHLEPVTRKENLRRGIGHAPINETKTHCARGHPFDDENTRVDLAKDGSFLRRSCRACDRARAAARRATGLRASHSIVSRRPDICQGVYCVAGTRFPVRALASFRDAGYSTQGISHEYPSLSAEQIERALIWWDTKRRTPAPKVKESGRTEMTAVVREFAGRAHR